MRNPKNPKSRLDSPEMKPKDQFVHYVNRKSNTYYLHAVINQKGQTRLVMKRMPEGALTHLPDGYVISENVNGVVSVGCIQPRIVTEFEEARIVNALKNLGLDQYRVEVKGVYITIYEPIGLDDDYSLLSEQMGIFTGLLKKALADMKNKRRLDPVMRFCLVDEERRFFEIERMTYRGRGGWMSLYKQGTLRDLADAYLQHLGKDSFYDLI